MRVTVKLGSILRAKAPAFVGGEGIVEMPGDGPWAVSDVMAALDIGPDEVNVIYRNHVLVAQVASGRRRRPGGAVPPELHPLLPVLPRAQD